MRLNLKLGPIEQIFQVLSSVHINLISSMYDGDVSGASGNSLHGRKFSLLELAIHVRECNDNLVGLGNICDSAKLPVVFANTRCFIVHEEAYVPNLNLIILGPFVGSWDKVVYSVGEDLVPV